MFLYFELGSRICFDAVSYCFVEVMGRLGVGRTCTLATRYACFLGWPRVVVVIDSDYLEDLV